MDLTQEAKPLTQRYRIVRIGKADAFYEDRKRFINKEGTMKQGVFSSKEPWRAGEFTFKNGTAHYFHRILLKKL